MHDVTAVALPHCICQLMCKDCWHDIGMLARWGPLFEAWPPEQWQLSRALCHIRGSPFSGSVPTESLMIPGMFQHIASELRELAATGEVGQPRASLRTLVEWADDCAASLLPSTNRRLQEDWEQSSSGQLQIKSECLLHCFIAVHNMSAKTKNAMTDTIHACIDSALPEALRSAYRATLLHGRQLPSPGTVRRAELMAEVATILHSREYNHH